MRPLRSVSKLYNPYKALCIHNYSIKPIRPFTSSFLPSFKPLEYIPDHRLINVFYGFVIGVTLSSIYNREFPGYERRIRRKAKKGKALAMVEYGEFLLSKKDSKKALKERYISRAFNLFQMASEQGNKTGHYYLGLLHKMEMIEASNPKAAFHHFSVSSMDRDEGDTDAHKQKKTISDTLKSQSKYELGLCYLEGYGVDRDCDLGLKILEEIGKNNGDSAYMLAQIYANGRYGVSVNSKRSLSWKKESALLGNTLAMEQMNELYLTKGKDLVHKEIPNINDYDSVKSPM